MEWLTDMSPDSSINEIKKILFPINKYVNNVTFASNLQQIINALLKDRNGDGKFTVDDLKLLSEDIVSLTLLIKSVILVIASAPSVKIKYSPDNSEVAVSKLLAYAVLVLIPEQTKIKWSKEEKEQIVQLIVLIYELIMSSKMVEHIFEKISTWFKKKGYCGCVSAETNSDIVDKHLPLATTKLTQKMLENKDIVHNKNNNNNKKKDTKDKSRDEL